MLFFKLGETLSARKILGSVSDVSKDSVLVRCGAVLGGDERFSLRCQAVQEVRWLALTVKRTQHHISGRKLQTVGFSTTVLCENGQLCVVKLVT